MHLITADEVIRRIDLFFSGHRLPSLRKAQARHTLPYLSLKPGARFWRSTTRKQYSNNRQSQYECTNYELYKPSLFSKYLQIPIRA